jgi:tetraacyldisaccharide 4'-kinase
MAPAPTRPRERLGPFVQEVWSGHGVLSTLLLPLAWIFGAVTGVRRQSYARGWLASHRLPVPVVVVGNLVAGGAGKTPTVIAVLRLLRSHGYSPGVVSRGYGRADESIRLVGADADPSQVGDEPLLLRRRTGVPVVVGRDRPEAARALLRAQPELDVIVSDDGLQHLALQRDVEVIVFDDRGAGNGRLLPAGPLRERVPARLQRHQVVLYNADVPSTPLPGHAVQRKLAGALPLHEWWQGKAPSRSALESLRGRPVLAVAGLARPQRFFAMLRADGIHAEELPLDDHHDFAVLPWPRDAGDVIVTEKDAVKLSPSRAIDARVWVAALDFEPAATFADALLSRLPPPRTRPPAAP